MPLPSELVYNSLDGEEMKQILCARFLDVLNQIPDLRKFITFPRVKMEMNLRFEVSGRTPPNFRIADEVVVTVNPNALPPLDPTQEEMELEAEYQVAINADDMADGLPPDQIREEHSLPVPTPQRGRGGAIEDVPVAGTNGRYASFVTLDYGPARQRTGGEGPLTIANPNAQHASPDVSFRGTEFGEAFTALQDSRKSNG